MKIAKPLRLTALLLACMMPLTSIAQIRAAFVYVGPANEVGWSYSHNEGRQYLERLYGNDIKTEYVEFAKEGRASTELLRQLAKENDIIFSTSSGLMIPTSRVAKEWPNVKFDNIGSLRVDENLGSYSARAYEPRYLSGIIAGSMTRNNRIGFVAAHAVPEVIRGLNAFVLGVKRVNPDAVVYVKWTHQWYDPEKSTQLARQLVENEGVDILTHHTDSPAVMTVAEQAGIYGISFHSDMSEFAPTRQLASIGYDWGVYYAEQIEALKHGDWHSDSRWLGMKEQVSQLNRISAKVPATVRQQVETVRQLIEQQQFKVFAGPIRNSFGREVVKAGESLSDLELERMNWYVDGLIGELPTF
ncbi:BMP family ABC transporter substrate-binding protein [Oceanobacter mangrovi]|uniref:BMP family ABC transporter substrate-binding protein n=1 Tax=Oceanobacter mangrovi TaxID=2862510 RepID=UPI001C8D164C|nr:BMP family ABC transporter substrate-binding protein [Oceanobacter mangrovi]